MSGGGSARLRGGSGKSCHRWGDTGGGDDTRTRHQPRRGLGGRRGPGISPTGGTREDRRQPRGGRPASAPPGSVWLPPSLGIKFLFILLRFPTPA